MGVRVGVALDANALARADAGSMLISQSSRFSELQSRIHGQVLTEGDEAWDASRQTFNLTHDQRPAALVRVASADDVAETVRYAAQRGLRIAPQSTGHNANDASTATALKNTRISLPPMLLGSFFRPWTL